MDGPRRRAEADERRVPGRSRAPVAMPETTTVAEVLRILESFRGPARVSRRVAVDGLARARTSLHEMRPTTRTACTAIFASSRHDAATQTGRPRARCCTSRRASAASHGDARAINARSAVAERARALRGRHGSVSRHPAAPPPLPSAWSASRRRRVGAVAALPERARLRRRRRTPIPTAPSATTAMRNANRGRLRGGREDVLRRAHRGARRGSASNSTRRSAGRLRRRRASHRPTRGLGKCHLPLRRRPHPGCTWWARRRASSPGARGKAAVQPRGSLLRSCRCSVVGASPPRAGRPLRSGPPQQTPSWRGHH